MIACLLINTDAALAGVSAAAGRGSITTGEKFPIAQPYEIFRIKRLVRGIHGRPLADHLGASRSRITFFEGRLWADLRQKWLLSSHGDPRQTALASSSTTSEAGSPQNP